MVISEEEFNKQHRKYRFREDEFYQWKEEVMVKKKKKKAKKKKIKSKKKKSR